MVSSEILWGFYCALCHRTAERWRPGTGVNTESSGLAGKPRTFKWFLAASAYSAAPSPIKIPEELNCLIWKIKEGIRQFIHTHFMTDRDFFSPIQHQVVFIKLGFGICKFCSCLCLAENRQNVMHKMNICAWVYILGLHIQQLKCAFITAAAWLWYTPVLTIKEVLAVANSHVL